MSLIFVLRLIPTLGRSGKKWLAEDIILTYAGNCQALSSFLAAKIRHESFIIINNSSYIIRDTFPFAFKLNDLSEQQSNV